VSNFLNFYRSFSKDKNLRGKQFEHFVKWFLVNDPIWRTQIEQIWLWDEYPQRWGKDLGIDLVFQNKNGELWAVQAKCYADTTSITKSHVDSFISESDSKTFSGRLLIGTTDSLADNAKKVCDRQNVTRFLLSDFESSSVEFPDHYDKLLRADPPKPPTPRDHQLEAISAVKQGFKDTDRGQLIMACGTGKTFTTLWIKEALDAQSTLILLPSLGLLSQTLHEWTKAANKSFEVLCVCSDDSVGKNSDDESYDSVAQLPFPVTSDPHRIQAFLELSKPKVVFSTYQSSPLVADAQAASTEVEFDLIVADEAHRCAGVVGDGFSSVLNGQRLRGKKRLFATATPRTYSKQIKNAAEGRGIEVVGMDDVEVFGKPLYTLSFGEAIERKLLTDYRVVIVGVDDAMLASWIEKREIVKTETGIQTDAKSLAGTVGLLKAINDYDLRRLISFHSRVSGAAAFAEEIHEVQKWMPEEARLKGKLNSDYVSGAMPTDKRRQKLSQLKNVTDGMVALLSNARCLSEGVDVPSLDGVAFIDPKNSQIDIIQAVGRAIRLSTNKSAGTIVLPVFIEKGETVEEVIERSDFKAVWGVLAALKAHDETFANELTQLRTEMGRKGESFKVQGLDKVIFDLPTTVNASLISALRSELVNLTTTNWDQWFGYLQRFTEQNGHSRVPQDEVVDGKWRLGYWVSNQRAFKLRGMLSSEREAKLAALPGWVWDAVQSLWTSTFRELEKYVQEHGHSRVPQKWVVNGSLQLGAWVSHQRKMKERMNPENRMMLESLNGWAWDPRDQDWRNGLEAYAKFISEKGVTKIPKDYQFGLGYSLDVWVKTQKRKRLDLTPLQQSELERLDGWTWKVLDEKWEKQFEMLLVFVAENGHARVPNKFAENKTLGIWVGTQRNRRNLMSDERRLRLEALQGWTWNPIDFQWENNFEALQRYVNVNGNALVPYDYKTADDLSLGNWVGTQRINKDSLPADRKTKLEALQGWTWDPFDLKWENGFDLLKHYVETHGNALVPYGFKSADNYSLGIWVGTQRANKDSLPAQRKSRLEALKGWVWSVKKR